MQDEDMGAVVLLEMAERNVLSIAGEVGESQRVAADGLEEARRPAAMLDVGASVGTRCGKE